MKDIERIEQILMHSMAMMDWNVSKSAKAIEQYVIKERIKSQIEILEEIVSGTDWRTTDKIVELNKELDQGGEMDDITKHEIEKIWIVLNKIETYLEKSGYNQEYEEKE